MPTVLDPIIVGPTKARRVILGDRCGLSEPFVRVLKRDPCVYCGLVKPNMTKEHIIPVKDGGEDSTETNVVGACKCCNNGKAGASLLSYLLNRRPRGEWHWR